MRRTHKAPSRPHATASAMVKPSPHTGTMPAVTPLQFTQHAQPTSSARRLYRLGLLLCLCWLAHCFNAVQAQPSVVTQPAARATLEHWQLLFAKLDMALMLIDADSGRIVMASRGAAAFYGYSQEVLQGMYIQDINTFSPKQVAAERALAAQEARNVFFFRHRLADGSNRLVAVRSQPLELAEGSLLLSYIQDFSDERQQQADVWHYQQRLEEQVDLQLIELANSRRQRILLLSTALVLQSLLLLALLLAWQRQRSLRYQQQQLLSEIQQRSDELGKLSEAMAHHFQEPTRRLLSFANSLQHSHGASQQQSLAFIAEQAQRLHHLLSAVQRYLALEQETSHSPQQVSSQAVLEQVLAAHQNALQAAQAHVHVSNSFPDLACSHRRQSLLWHILIDNALRYRRPEQALELHISASLQPKQPRQRNQQRPPEQRVTLRVSDNGTGIPPAYRQQVLGLFKRLVHHSEVPGAGLGLALLSKAVRQQGGNVRIEDGIDGGICVIFDMPSVKSNYKTP